MGSLLEEEILATSPTTEDYNVKSHIPKISLYLTMCATGIIANFIFWKSVSCYSKSRPRNNLLLSVIVADSLVCLVSGTLTICFLTKWPTWIRILPTYLGAFLQDVPISLSAMSTMVLSVDRYLTVRSHRNFTPFSGKSYVNYIIGGTWSIAIVMSCIQFVPEKLQKTMTIVHVVLGHLIPALIIFITHAAVHSTLTAVSLTARAQHGELPLPMPLLGKPTDVIIVAGISKPSSNSTSPQTPTQVAVEEPQGSNETKGSPRSRKRLANTYLLGATIFLVCWIPHIVALLCKEFTKDDWSQLSFWGFFAGHMHSAINPILYLCLQSSISGSDSNKNRSFLQKWGMRRSASSTNEAQLGPFNPRFIQFAAKRQYRHRPSSTNVFF